MVPESLQEAGRYAQNPARPSFGRFILSEHADVMGG